jgi:hypothetical protein
MSEPTLPPSSPPATDELEDLADAKAHLHVSDEVLLEEYDAILRTTTPEQAWLDERRAAQHARRDAMLARWRRRKDIAALADELRVALAKGGNR